MSHVHDAGERAGFQPGNTLRGSLADALLALVSRDVEQAADRARQAVALGCLIGLGLAAAATLPITVVADLGSGAGAAASVLAGCCLAAAGLLSATGRLDTLLFALQIIAAGALAALAAEQGGLASPILALLAIAPAEALIHGRRKLFLSGLAASATAGAVLAAAELAGRHASPASDGVLGVVVAAMLGYVALLTLRLARARNREEPRRESAEAESGDAATLRFDLAGDLVTASAAAKTLFEGIGQPGRQMADLLHVTDRIEFLKAFCDVRAGAKGEIAVVARTRTGVGEAGFSQIRFRLSSTRSSGGEVTGVLALADDTSPEAPHGSQLHEALAEATRSSAAKSHFLAAVSHELRTPLNAIIGFSDILDQEIFGGFENARQKEYVGLIRQSGEHLLSVVNGLLDISKIEAGRYELAPEPFRLCEAMVAAADMMRAEAARKGLRLDVRDGCAGAEIAADRRACHQMLLNLLSNALKFTDKGVVTLESRIVGDSVSLSVSDTGIGIAAEEIVKLGTPFTQVSSGLARRYQGTGLGLSLVKGLAELHHGSMEIVSDLGVGTMVTVRLPLDCAERIEASRNLKENVVALSHVRTQKTIESSAQQKRLPA